MENAQKSHAHTGKLGVPQSQTKPTSCFPSHQTGRKHMILVEKGAEAHNMAGQ